VLPVHYNNLSVKTSWLASCMPNLQPAQRQNSYHHQQHCCGHCLAIALLLPPTAARFFPAA
jgi:hypothetical protein